MTWFSTINLSTLQQNNRHKLKINNKDVLLLWHQNEVHAVQSQCPHLKLPLTKGTLTDNGEIICPFHKSTFNLKTGDVACWSPWPPLVGKLLGKISREKQLPVYPTRIEDDVIWVDV